jgi:hypothetical protein
MVLAFVSFTLLTPLAALVAFAAVLPLVAFAVAGRRVARVRAVLGLPPPPRANRRAVAAAAVLVLLGIAAAQPTVTTGSHVRARTDAGVLFVLDTSRSMAAAARFGGRTRLERAVDAAKMLRAAVPGVRAGIATLTDRVVPNLLPVPDRATFDATLTQAIGIEQPSPLEVQARSTTYTALTEIPGGNYFGPSVTKRIAVLLTDGETRPFDGNELTEAFQRPPTKLIAVQFWHAHESVYTRHGNAEAAYVPDPTSHTLLETAVASVGGELFREGELPAVTRALHAVVGTGPVREVRGPARSHALAPFVAALALLPLAFVFLPGLPRRRRAAPAAAPHEDQPSASWSTRAWRILAASTNPSRS